MAKCTVSYKDSGGVEHSTEVLADSLEAAALGLEALSGGELIDSRPGPQTVMEITVHPPPVVHRMRVGQLRGWLNETAKGPREMLLKERLKAWWGK